MSFHGRHFTRLLFHAFYSFSFCFGIVQALQSSEEARIAYRFSAHLEKMHGQLLTPDTVSSFKSYHDILARLLPYHIYAEPEPPAAAVEQGKVIAWPLNM